ncbi:hypothetical protein AAZV13_09G172300 [Glycine max]
MFWGAEKKQVTGHAVKDWLQKLTDAAYVLHDILDECSIQSIYPIFGMAGLGKTTLAKQVFNDANILTGLFGSVFLMISTQRQYCNPS